MADDIQQMLEAVRRASGGTTSTTAIAEPEEEESSPEKPQPALSDMLKAIRGANLPKPPKEDLSEAARVMAQPTPSLTDRAARVGQSMVPMEPPSTAPPPPHLVRGPFGQPIPPQPVEDELESQAYRERQAAEQSDEEKQRMERLDPLSRIAVASTQTPNTMLGPQVPTGPPTFGQKVEAGVLHGATGMRPDLAARVARGTGERPLALEAAIPPSATGIAPGLERGVLRGASGLLSPDNIALLASMEGMGGVLGNLARQSRELYETAEQAAEAEDWAKSGEALAKAEKIAAHAKPLAAIHAAINPVFTYQMATGLYQDLKGLKKAVDQGDWQTAAELLGEAIPNGIFTAEGARSIYSGVARVREGISARASAREAARNAPAPEPEEVPQLPPGPPKGGAAPAPVRTPEPQPQVPPVAPVPTEPPTAQAPETLSRAATVHEPLDEAGVEAQPSAALTPASRQRAIPTSTTASSQLPRDLAGAKPRYGIGQNQFKLDFESDLDKSLYILAQTKPSARDADYLAFAQRSTGKPEAQLRQMGREVRSRIKALASQSDQDEITVPATGSATMPREDSGVPTEPPSVMEHAPPGGFTEADKVPSPTERAYKLGKAAFDRGAKLAPSMDPQITRMLKEPATKSGAGDQELLKAYHRGWNEANLAAPVPALPARTVAPPEEVESQPQQGVPTEPPSPTPGYRFSSVSPSADRWNKMGTPERLGYLQDYGFSERTAARLASKPWDELEKRVQTPLSAAFAREHEQAIVPPEPESSEPHFTVGQRVQFTRGGKELSGTIRSVEAGGEYDIDTEQVARIGRAPIGRIEVGVHEGAIRPFEEESGVPMEPPTAPRAAEVPLGPERPEEASGITPEAESARLPAEEEQADESERERPTEPARSDLRTQSLGEAGEGSLEAVPPEDVRGAGEDGSVARDGGEGGGADRVRPDEYGESGLSVRRGVGSGEGEVSVPSDRGGRAGPGPKPGQLTTGNRPQSDYRITEADAIGSGGERTKYSANVAAIRLLKQLELEGRLATPEEQQTLVKYVGWGGIAPNQLFNERTQGGKQWAGQYQEIKSLLTPDEYNRARASTTNAHYTSAPVVSAIWDALQRMGFAEGKMLEPGAGIGGFLGLMPPELSAHTRKTAVELDPVSGRILKQLYQSADVRVQDFADFKAPNDSFDVVAGNVPFGAAKMYDPAYKDRLSIHNYFIVKSLDKLRPGGIAALITSHHTLDAIDPAAKKLIRDRADLLGAIRLPNTAFKGNARTEVTTDVLFFRKREPDESIGGKPFSSLKEITSPKGSKLKVNEYFADNPDMMLGDMELAGTMRAAGEPALIPRTGQDLSSELQKAIGKLPENALKPRAVPESVTDEATADSIPDFRETKQYGLAIKGGKVFRRVGDAMEEMPDYPKNTVSALKEMLGLRDATRELLQAEARDLSQTQLDDLRRRLNASYDRFTKKNGLIHSSRNEKAMYLDPDRPLLLSLENYDKKARTATKADIFNKRVISPVRTIERADTPKDAMLVSLAEKGRLDFNRMADLTGKSVEEIEADLKSDGLAFHSPDGHWEPSDVYLSGNVRKKLAEASEAARTNEEFKPNVEALRAVIPEDLPPSQISVRLGASWIPRDVVRDFIAHVLDAPFPERIRVGHIESKGLWTLSGHGFAPSTDSQLKWGTKRRSPLDIIEDGLNQRVPVVWDADASGKKSINLPETEAAKEKLSQLNDEFHRWLFEDSPHAEEMARQYNEKFNSEVEWKPDGSHLTLPGSSAGITLRPWQKDAIWRGVSGKNNLLLAHEVGLGKTFILHGIAMEWRRLGLKKKPMIVVPTNLVEQSRQDFLKLYPAANVLAAEPDSFEKDNRKEFQSRIATGDWDSVIIGDSQFSRLPVGASLYKEFMNEELEAARQQLSEIKSEGGDYRTVKEIENQIADMEGDIDELADREKKDQTIAFEELGVDGLLIDEAHRMKSLWFQTKMGRVRGVPRTKSKRAMDTYMKAKYITRLNNGNGVVFATGTPITNTVAEAWILAKFLDEGMLKEMGMQHFDSWAANFGQSVTKAEGFPENPSKLRMMTRFSQFNNVAEASALFRRTADVKFAEDVGLPRPKMAEGKMVPHVVQPSGALLDYIQDLVERAKRVRGRPPEPGGDNMLVITNDGRKAAIDMRMVDADAADDPDSKLNQAARIAAEKYHATRDTKTTQLLMLDLREGAGGFDAYKDIRSKLVSMGVPREEIQFIQDFNGSAKKQVLFNAVNDGKVAILLGSTETLGVGVNVQKRLGKLIHIDAPWRPDGIEQRNGRAIRQGNMHLEMGVPVEVTPMVTEKSFDAYIWDLLKRKSDFIKKFLKGDPTVRQMEDIGAPTLNFDEIQAIASGDQRIFEKMETESEIQRLESLAKAHYDQQFDNKARLARLPEQIEGYRERAAAIEQDIQTRDEKKLEKFGITIGKKHFADRKAAGTALNDEMVKFEGQDGSRSVGEYAGFQITIRGDRTGHVQGNMAYPFNMGVSDREPSPTGTIQSVEGAIRTLESKLESQQDQATKFQKELADRKKEAGKPFPQQKKLSELTGKLNALNKDLGIDKTGDEGPEDPSEDKEPPDDLTMSFLGLQGIYNKLARLVKRMRSKPPEGTVPDERAEDRGNVPPYLDEMRDLQTGVAERAGNIRLDKLNTSDDVLNLIRQTAKQHAARIAAQRRGKLSDKELKQRMEDVGLDPEKLAKLPKGTALNEAEMQTAVGIMLDKGEEVRNAQRAAQKSDSTENLLRAQQLHNEYVAIQAAVSGAKAESGRALRIQRTIAEAFQSKGRSGYERVIDALGGRELAEKERDKLLQIPEDDRIGYFKFLRDHSRFTTPQKIVAYWVNNILSSPHTVARKFLGDASMAALSVPNRFVRASVDPLVARLQRRSRAYFLRDAIAQTGAYMGAIPEGLRAGAFMLANGFDLQDAEELDLPYRYELPGGLAMNWPTRLLGGATAMFKTMHYKSALAGEAMRQALKEELTGREAGERAAELLESPTDEMVSHAWDEARTLALVEKPDATLRSLLNFRERFLKVPEDVPVVGGLSPMRFVVPFATVGWNIAKNAFRYSPLGAARLLREDTRESPEASNVVAQALVGSLIMSALAYWASQGNMTGAAPKSQKDRDAFFAAGKQAFSIKVGSRWVRYTAGWGPIALMAGAVAGWYDAFKEKDVTPGWEQVGQVAAALGNAITDQTFFRGLQNLDEAISNPSRYGAQWVSEIAGGFVPFSGFDRTFAEALDPDMRAPEGIYERVQSGLPVLSRNVPARLDVLGRPVERRGGTGAAAFLPAPMPEDKPESNVDAELARLNDKGLKYPGYASRFFTIGSLRVPMSRDERSEYQRMRGSLIRLLLGRMFSSENYTGLSDEQKIKEVEEGIREVDDAARDQMITRVVDRRLGRQEAGVPMGPPGR